MTLEITGDNEMAVVMMPKRMDAENAPVLEEDLKALMRWNSPIVIMDFSATDYIASAGLRVLLVTTRNLMKGGTKTALISLSPQVLRVFDMAGFTQIFSIHATKEEALKKLQSSG
ncbi:MAG: STAS domain protein [Methanoregula sp. PtaU1.Bin051]|nr:MAG: STAS domain protein [Methanoregula sp. PtaU1.Bin051]